jgi:hypothetical protein
VFLHRFGTFEEVAIRIRVAFLLKKEADRNVCPTSVGKGKADKNVCPTSIRHQGQLNTYN